MHTQNVTPAYFKHDHPKPPEQQNINILVHNSERLSKHLCLEYEWLEKTNLTNTLNDGMSITWSAHHASGGVKTSLR